MTRPTPPRVPNGWRPPTRWQHLRARISDARASLKQERAPRADIVDVDELTLRRVRNHNRELDLANEWRADPPIERVVLSRRFLIRLGLAIASVIGGGVALAIDDEDQHGKPPPSRNIMDNPELVAPTSIPPRPSDWTPARPPGVRETRGPSTELT